MASGEYNGQMEKFMRVNGKMVRNTVKAKFVELTVFGSKAFGSMEKK